MRLTEGAARRWILAAAVAGVALRAAFGLVYWVGKPLTHDEREYLALARSLATGRGFVYEPSEEIGTSQRFGRGPAYPAFLALIGAGRHEYQHAPARVQIVQAFVGGATVWLIGVIATGAAGPRAGLAAATIAAAYPPLVWICAYVYSEALYSATALLAAFLLQRGVSGPRGRSEASRAGHATAAGALTGLAILIRPPMLLFLPLAATWLVARRRTTLVLALVAGAATIVAPWTVRNVRVYDRFVLVSSAGGVNFWIGNHPLARGEGDLAANPDLKQADLEFRRAHPGLTPEELEPLYYREAFAWIAANPGRWALLLVQKLFYTVVPTGPSYTLHSTRYWAASIVSYLLLLACAIPGFPGLWRTPARPTAVLLLAASSVLAGLMFFPQERYRIPVLDPVLILAAAARFGRGALA